MKCDKRIYPKAVCPVEHFPAVTLPVVHIVSVGRLPTPHGMDEGRDPVSQTPDPLASSPNHIITGR
jgi:hypothetical protein